MCNVQIYTEVSAELFDLMSIIIIIYKPNQDIMMSKLNNLLSQKTQKIKSAGLSFKLTMCFPRVL